MKREETRYRYPLWAVLSSTVPASVALVSGLVLLPRWSWTVFAVLSALAKGELPSRDLLWFLAAGWMPLVIGATLLSLYTEVAVTEKGMKVRVFWFKWIFIPWEDVLGITVPRIPGGNDPSLWRFVRVSKLTPFHRLLSIGYGTGSDPVLVIGKQIEHYERLIRIIEEHIEQNQSCPSTAN